MTLRGPKLALIKPQEIQDSQLGSSREWTDLGLAHSRGAPLVLPLSRDGDVAIGPQNSFPRKFKLARREAPAGSRFPLPSTPVLFEPFLYVEECVLLKFPIAPSGHLLVVIVVAVVVVVVVGK